MSLKLIREEETREIAFKPGQSIASVLHDAGLPMNLHCGGLGICGKCKVKLLSGRFKTSGKEINADQTKSLLAPACKTEILSEDAAVSAPEKFFFKPKGKIQDSFKLPDFSLNPPALKFFLSPKDCAGSGQNSLSQAVASKLKVPSVSWHPAALAEAGTLFQSNEGLSVTAALFNGSYRIINVEKGNKDKSILGAAIDIGTTTVALLISDLKNGKILAKASAYNQQITVASDVASRISAASASDSELKRLGDLVIKDTINPLLKEAAQKCGHSTDEIFRVAVSGNTVMLHLFLGLSPESIGRIPFLPLLNVYDDHHAGELGISANPAAVVNSLPCISGYAGGDITADIYVSKLSEVQELTALIDIGTNSEMVLAEKGRLSVSAAAAGPAFEGAGIICGCRAAKGAVEHIDFDANLDFKLEIIDDTKINGICGSAIIDFLACAHRYGLINIFGRYDIELLKKHNRYISLELPKSKIHACVIADASMTYDRRPLLVSEQDIEQVLKAKAAVYSGLQTMLSLRGETFASLKKIILAGGFARYIRLENAVEIGLLPKGAEKITEYIGNGSLAGAYLSLTDIESARACIDIIKKPSVVSLNTAPDFENNFIDALMLPENDI